MRAFPIILLFTLIGSIGHAQSDLMNRSIEIKPGKYTARELMELIKKHEISISYSQDALVRDNISMETSPVTIAKLLSQAIDTANYRPVVREEKILIVPLSSRNIKTYSGFIEEAGSQERLVGVNITIPELNIGTTTNAYGYYSLSVPVKDTLEAIISYLGYERKEFLMYEGNGQERDFQLEPINTQLSEVVVTGKIPEPELVQMSEVSLTPSTINNVPTIMGETDVIKVLQLLPGVQGGLEGSSGLMVRGGSPDQNLLLLDGVPVYNASHLFGFFSVFNTDAIKNVSLTKGGFPARYGGRLSSVINIDMKEGNMQEFHGKGSVGLIASRLSLEGPIIKNKTSFAVSGRRTYADLLLKPFWDADNDVGYFFHDFNAKVNHIFNRNDRIYLSFYGGKDQFYFNQDDGNYLSENYLKWGNLTGSLRWNHIYNNRLFGNLTALYSQYEFGTGVYEETSSRTSGFDYFSRIEDKGLRYDLEYQPLVNHQFRLGAGYTLHDFRPRTAEVIQDIGSVSDTNIDISESIRSHDIFLYAEDQWSISNRWKANYGLHYAQYLVDNQTYQSLQPRISLRYLANDSWSLKASYAQMMQSVHLLTNSTAGLPTDIWVSATDAVKPQYSQQLALGSFWDLGKSWELSSEIYYKWMRNLIAYKEGAGFLNASDWVNSVEMDGEGKAYGLEFMLKRHTGKTTGWLSYTLARTTRQFSNINQGKIFPFRYDRRHDLSLVINHRFSKRFDISLNWVYQTGPAFTMPLSEYYVIDEFGQPDLAVQYSDRNALRMPDYHRLDLGFNFHKKTKWGRSTWSLSLYNAYSRQNPFFIDIQPDGNTGKNKIVQLSLFPILPSFSYNFSF